MDTTSGPSPVTWAKRIHRTKTMLAVEALRETILRDEIKPGERLTMAHLSAKLGMSPTPIREAIRVLEAQGLLQHTPHYGVSVASFSMEDAREVYMMRAILEPLATRLAATRLDATALQRLHALEKEMEDAYAMADAQRLAKANAQWHLCIYEGAQSRLLYDIILQLWSRFPWEVIWVVPNLGEHSLEQHRAVVTALDAHDEDEAESVMRAHIVAGKESVLAHLRSRNDGEDLRRE